MLRAKLTFDFWCWSYTEGYFNFNRNLNFNRKLLKASKGASPHQRLSVCGRVEPGLNTPSLKVRLTTHFCFEVEVAVEVEVENTRYRLPSSAQNPSFPK
jgi:hypothetical protein